MHLRLATLGRLQDSIRSMEEGLLVEDWPEGLMGGGHGESEKFREKGGGGKVVHGWGGERRNILGLKRKCL